MRIRITNASSAGSVAWKVVKGWLVLLMIWLTLPPLSSSVQGTPDEGLKTVLTGRIRAVQLVPITLDFSARVVAVHVKPGQRVKAGEVLAELESREVQERAKRVRRRMELAAARLRAEPDTAGRLWREQLENAERQDDEARAQVAAFTLAAAEAALQRAEIAFATMKSMVAQRLVTAGEVEASQRHLDAERLNLESAKRTKLRLEHEARAAASHLRMVLLQKPASGTRVDPARQLEYEEAQAALELAEAQREALRVVAPQDGTILTVAAQVGAQAGGWSPLFQMADLKNLQVEVPVTARVAGMVRAGTPVRVAIPSDPPQTVTGKAGEIQLVPDQLEHSHVVRILLPNPQPQSILIGMECAVEFSHGGQS